MLDGGALSPCRVGIAPSEHVRPWARFSRQEAPKQEEAPEETRQSKPRGSVSILGAVAAAGRHVAARRASEADDGDFDALVSGKSSKKLPGGTDEEQFASQKSQDRASYS